MASNNSAGTRGISAGDWVRLKRLNGARTVVSSQTGNLDINGSLTNNIQYPPPFHSPFTAGSSRIRRTASAYIDFVGSQRADYVTQIKSGAAGNLPQLFVTGVCNCIPVPLTTRQGVCVSCKHLALT